MPTGKKNKKRRLCHEQKHRATGDKNGINEFKSLLVFVSCKYLSTILSLGPWEPIYTCLKVKLSLCLTKHHAMKTY